jgi:hypothetical protein
MTERTPERPLEDHYFGLWDGERQSLVLAKDDCLIGYGTSFARQQLLRRVKEWVDLGMPAAASFKLQVHPGTRRVEPLENQWAVERSESTFVWGLQT